MKHFFVNLWIRVPVFNYENKTFIPVMGIRLFQDKGSLSISSMDLNLFKFLKNI